MTKKTSSLRPNDAQMARSLGLEYNLSFITCMTSWRSYTAPIKLGRLRIQSRLPRKKALVENFKEVR